jgi:hypothetical protein
MLTIAFATTEVVDCGGGIVRTVYVYALLTLLRLTMLVLYVQYCTILVSFDWKEPKAGPMITAHLQFPISLCTVTIHRSYSFCYRRFI